MSGWSDTFDRADGPMGSDWSVMRGTCTIDDNRAVMVPTATMQAVQMSYAGDLDIGFTLDPTYCIGSRAQLVVHTNTTYGANMTLQVQSFVERYEVALVEYDGGFGTFTRAIGNQAYSATTPVYFSVRLVGTHWSILANGVELDDYDGAGSSSGSAVLLQMVDTAAAILSFNVPQEASALAVAPDPVWVGGGSVQMVATGTLTSWTAGVPGSSTITVDHGTIEDQWTEDATTIHFTLVPAEYVGTLTFTESEYGLTDEVTATLTPQEGQGGGECPFNDEFVEVANRTGLLDEEAALLTNSSVIYSPGGGAGDLKAVDALRDLWLAEFVYDTNPPPGPSLWSLIWQILNGTNDPPTGPFLAPSSIPVAQHLDGITTALSNLTGEGAWTLALLLGELAGPLGTNLSDLEADLGVHTQMAYASVIDAINVTRGPEMPTLTSILSAIEAINPGGTTDLTAVMDLLNYITADRAVNINSVLSTLATMRGDNSSTLHAIQAYCVTAIAKLDEIKTYLQDQLGPMTVTLAAIEAKVDAILALLQQIAVTRFQPPVWPGLANVDLGDSISLTFSNTVPGPMDGVIVDINGTDPGTGFYDYDVSRCWRNIGALAFVTDNGYIEMWQPLGFTRGIFVPKTMTRASAVKLHLGRGPYGWIQPWTFK